MKTAMNVTARTNEKSEQFNPSYPDSARALHGISLEKENFQKGPADTILVDLGTTTIALILMEQTSGALRQSYVFSNPHRKYGADVISRIQASMIHDRKDLKRELIDGITQACLRLCEKNKSDPSRITRCLIAGNTAMIHLLMGYDCRPLSSSPFQIQEASPQPFYYKNCLVQIVPWISAFLGGDITAGLYACSLERSPQTNLFIDLGTNGEMVLSHGGKFYAAATAAGPTFEGQGLSHGCPAIDGAISHIKYHRLQPSLTTIRNKIPVGICGSGAISVTARLLEQGYMNPQGILSSSFPDQGIFLANRVDGTPIYFTAQDLRNVQMSVAAISAGIQTLLHTARIPAKKVDTVYLGGGFGFFLDLEDCQTLRMFTDISSDRIQVCGNTCLRGLYNISQSESFELSPPVIRTINLAESEYFKACFLSHMSYDKPDSSSNT